jgi:hypothetical protein
MLSSLPKRYDIRFDDSTENSRSSQKPSQQHLAKIRVIDADEGEQYSPLITLRTHDNKLEKDA